MATKTIHLIEKEGYLDDLKENITLKGKPRKKEKLPKKQCRKTKESKQKYYKSVQGEQCLDSLPTTLEGNEEFGQPIPELYPELSEELERPMDTGISDENNEIRESLSDLQNKEQLDGSQNSSEDSQPIGIKKRRKMLIPKKIERQLDIDDSKDFSVPNPTDEHYHNPKDNDLSEKQTQRTGSWVQCSLPHCGKWRCLNVKVDPNKLPDKWVCGMNPDSRYNRCQASQEDFDSQDEDFDVVYSPYPEGAIVWAKLAGYPWWPCMMENDPDYVYYCETQKNSREPISYHVVFFDKDVSRAWVNSCSIRPFHADDNPEDQGNVVIRKKNFKKKLDLAAQQAKQALSLPPENRVNVYGFARRFKGPIGHQNKTTKDKKTKAVMRMEDIEEEEEEEKDKGGEDKEEDDYLNSAEINDLSESSENFSEEFCKKTKEKTSIKKMKKAYSGPNQTNKPAKKGRKKEKDKEEKSDESSAVKSTADKAKKDNKPRKKTIDKIEKAAKNDSSKKGKKMKNDTQVIPMNAVSEDNNDLVISPTNSESPKSPIPPSHEMAYQVLCDVTKETSIKEKTETTNTKKRKLAEKNNDGQEKKEKIQCKEPKQADQEKETYNKPAKQPAKKMTKKCTTQEPEVQVEKMTGLETSLAEEEKSKEHVTSEKTPTEDAQIPETVTVQPSSTASSSLQFINMPKLIKASFKPPSKKGSESNTSGPNLMKMPKLKKSQFVCPAATAAEIANNLIKGNKKEQNIQSDNKDRKLQVQAKMVELKRRRGCDDKERCSIADKRPLVQVEAVQNGPGLSDKVEVELAKLDRDIEDMKKEFHDSMNPNKEKEMPQKGDNILADDSPEF